MYAFLTDGNFWLMSVTEHTVQTKLERKVFPCVSQQTNRTSEETTKEYNSIITKHTDSITSHLEFKIEIEEMYSLVSCCSNTSMSCCLCQRQDEHST